MATLKFESLVCIRRQDISGKDEPQLVVDGEVLWNGKAKKGLPTPLNGLSYRMTKPTATIQLNEMDGGKAKALGTVTVREGQDAPPPAVFTTSGAHYELHYSVT